jgi:hypothetical protein
MSTTTTTASVSILGSHGEIQPDGFKCTAPLTLALVAGVPFQINLTQQQNLDARFLSAAISLYIDNGGNANPVTFQFSSGQVIVWPADMQGYINILQPNPIAFQATCSANATATIMMINALMAPQMWLANAL